VVLGLAVISHAVGDRFRGIGCERDAARFDRFRLPPRLPFQLNGHQPAGHIDCDLIIRMTVEGRGFPGAYGSCSIGIGGRPFTVKGVYREIQRPRLLAFTWLPSWQENSLESLVRFDLEEKGGITTVRLTHSCDCDGGFFGLLFR
jgi:hypothetical protein